MPLIQFGQYDPTFEIFTRVTEASDTRITEAGDIRITNDEVGNTGVSTLIADPTLISFSSQPYYNDNNVWKAFIPYVKDNGTWKQPIAIYKNVNGNWKRVY